MGVFFSRDRMLQAQIQLVEFGEDLFGRFFSRDRMLQAQVRREILGLLRKRGHLCGPSLFKPFASIDNDHGWNQGP